MHQELNILSRLFASVVNVLTRLEYLLVSVQFTNNLHRGVAEISKINVNGAEDETRARNLSLE